MRYEINLKYVRNGDVVCGYTITAGVGQKDTDI